LIKTDYCLSIDERDRRALIPHGKQFFQRRLILANILVDERNPFLRKKLFLSVARPSTRLGKDGYRLGHSESSSLGG